MFNGPLESDELRTGTCARVGSLSLEGFADSDADWLGQLMLYIADPATVVDSPHKVWGPQTATAGPRHPKFGDGYQAALVNPAFLAHAVPSTAEAVTAMATESPRVLHTAAASALQDE